MRAGSEREPYTGSIAEDAPLASDQLIVLVTLAGHQHHIDRRGLLHCAHDRLAAVVDDAYGRGCSAVRGGARGRGAHALDPAQNRSCDLARILATRIVVGDDDFIGPLSRDAPHLRALAGVPLAPAAEH